MNSGKRLAMQNIPLDIQERRKILHEKVLDLVERCRRHRELTGLPYQITIHPHIKTWKKNSVTPVRFSHDIKDLTGNNLTTKRLLNVLAGKEVELKMDMISYAVKMEGSSIILRREKPMDLQAYMEGVAKKLSDGTIRIDERWLFKMEILVDFEMEIHKKKRSIFEFFYT